MKKYKIVISDCHIAGGRFLNGRQNPFEALQYEEALIELITYFSTGNFGITEDNNPIEVELILAGDFLDFLFVPYRGEFTDTVTEKISVTKLDSIFSGHAELMTSLKDFASKPGKYITYLIGNHDSDLFYPKVRDKIIRHWDPDGQFPSKKIRIVHNKDRIIFSEGVEIHHGNQYEAMSFMHFDEPILTKDLPVPIINLSWGCLYFLNIISHFKWEIPYMDRVRPIKLFIFLMLIIKPILCLRYMFFTATYFLRTRFFYSPKRRSPKHLTWQILKEEVLKAIGNSFQDLAKEARVLLEQNDKIHTIILGHTHTPMEVFYPDGKKYINTGTWTKTVNIDPYKVGVDRSKTFAFITIEEGKAQCELRQWTGTHAPHTRFRE